MGWDGMRPHERDLAQAGPVASSPRALIRSAGPTAREAEAVRHAAALDVRAAGCSPLRWLVPARRRLPAG
jgi:hypothetical protein